MIKKAWKLVSDSDIQPNSKTVKTKAVKLLSEDKLTGLLAAIRDQPVAAHQITVAELCEIPEEKLRQWKSMGALTLEYIKAVLASYNLELGSKSYITSQTVREILRLYNMWEREKTKNNVIISDNELIDFIVSNYNLKKTDSIGIEP